MDILIVRHAKAFEREDWEGAERERPLTDEGQKQFRKYCRKLRGKISIPTSLLTSPFTRAWQTAELLCDHLWPKGGIQPQEFHHLRPGGHKVEVLQHLRTLSSDHSCVALVGHEPDLGDLASSILCPPSEGLFELRKGGIIKIKSFPESPQLSFHIHRKLLSS